MMILGYVRTSPRVRSDGTIAQASNWRVLILGETLTEYNWVYLCSEFHLIDYWES
jgi:hypothetical protein